MWGMGWVSFEQGVLKGEGRGRGNLAREPPSSLCAAKYITAVFFPLFWRVFVVKVPSWYKY